MILNLYGYDRAHALDLPHWEFWHIYDTHFKLKALETIDLRQAIGSLISSEGYGDYLEDLQIRAGMRSTKALEDSKDEPWTLALFRHLGG